jgi:RND superfamily putative drug exporter
VNSLRERPEVAGVGSPRPTREGRRIELAIAPSSAPDEQPARDLVRDLRDEDAAGRGLAGVADVRIGGTTALTADFVHLIETSLWKIALFIVVTSFLILTFMLRSLLLPLKAVFMTLLSVASAYGVLVAIFQWGWLDGLLGYESPGEIGAIVPPLLLATVFGLSMDYEVFLLSRIREFRESGCDDREAVARGLRASAGTITSAALIMVSVFLVFSAVSSSAIQEIGVGLAVAIALDATLVRLVLVPATMGLLGEWNWWLPQALDRRLPRLAHEAMPPQEVP